MKTMKYLGCLLALVFAATSLHAKSTSFTDWFATTIATELASEDGAWTNTAGWDFSKTDYNLNNWSSDKALTFTVTQDTEKTLPGDVAAIKTTVKFTAMDKADFDEQFPEGTSELIDDAKAGLTVVEVDSVNTYYGIVSGKWEALTGTPDLTQELDVKVTLSKNGEKQYVKYEVGPKGQALTALTLNSKSEIETTATEDATISSVSYKGLCKLTALSGEGAKSIFDLTVPTKGNATAVVEVNGAAVQPTATTDEGDVYEITSGSIGSGVTVAYKPASGYKVYGTQPAPITADLTGNTTLEVPSDLQSRLIIAFVGEELLDDLSNAYDTFAAALGVAGDDAVITIIQNTALGVAIDKDVTITGSVDIAISDANILVSNELTIAGCTFAGEFDFDDAGCTVLKGGQFAKISKAEAQKCCAKQYFAQDYSTAGSKVVEGTAPSGNIPVAYDPAIIPIGEDAEKYLTEKAQNDQPRWVNYALGLEPETTVEPSVKKVEATATSITIGTDLPGNPGTGYEIAYTIDDVETAGVLNLADIATKGAVTLKMKVVKQKEANGPSLSEADPTDEEVVMTKTIGAKEPEVSPKEKGDFKIVAAVYKKVSGADMTVDDVVNKANLQEGDKISVYRIDDKGNGVYYTWALDADHEWIWEAVNIAGKGPIDPVAASGCYLKSGEGLWLKTASDKFYQYGEVGEVVATMTEGENLLANPIPGTPLALSKIANAKAGDKIIVENLETLIPTEYTYKDGKWMYWKPGKSTTVMVRGNKVTTTEPATYVEAENIPTYDSGLWYVAVERKAEESAASIAW